MAEQLISKSLEMGFSMALLLGAVLWFNKRNNQKELELKTIHKEQIDEQKAMTKQVMELHEKTLTTIANNTEAYNRMSDFLIDAMDTKRAKR